VTPSGPQLETDLLARGARGAVALGLRQVVVQLVSVAAAVVLARVLTPAEFGVYGITVFLMHFLVAFGDAGLAAGLVREASEPDDEDYQAVFTFQQVLVAVIAAAGVALAPWLAALLSPGGGLGLLLPAALVALVLASFQTMPAARLERHLNFDKLAIVEAGQALVFNGIAVACALAGLGANSMAIALVARAAAGAALVQVVAPWPVVWRWDWQRVRSRLHFGLSYQGTALVNLARDSLVPVFVGATLGNAAVGGIFFARMLAFYPLLILYMLQRLLLPLFARLQRQPEEFARAVESSLFAVAALVVPVQTAVWALQEPVVRIVFGEQWLASLDVYRWLWVAGLIEPQLVVGLALLNALGHADRVLRFVVVTTVLTWLAGVPLLLLFGPVGFGIAGVLMLGVKWTLMREADAESRTRSIAVVAPVWAAGFASAALTAACALVWSPTGPGALAVLLVISLLLYVAMLLVLARERCGAALSWTRSQWRPAAGEETAR
jgi:O-antigen/teichoic acid export membrane protein